MHTYMYIRNPTACKKMEHCHAYAENEDDVEADISKYIRFCVVTLKAAILIAEGIFDHNVNNCIFQDILERKFALVEMMLV